MIKFNRPKNPFDEAWYQARFTSDRLASVIDVSPRPNTASAVPLTVSESQVTPDGFGVAFLVGGGSDRQSFVINVSVLTTGGSRLRKPVRLDVLDD